MSSGHSRHKIAGAFFMPKRFEGKEKKHFRRRYGKGSVERQRMKKLAKEFSRYALLSVLGMVGVSCYILADTFFVAQGLGTNGLAALNLAIPAYNLINGTALMLGIGGATRYSVYKTQGDDRNAWRVFTNTVYLAACFSVIYMLMGCFASGALARLLGADAQTFAMTQIYLRVLLLFSPAFLFNTVLMCFVRNDGAPHTAMFATVSGSLANILLDYVFIFPCGMGMLGAVLATGFAPVIGLGFSASHILRGKNGFRFLPRGASLRLMRCNFTLGFPSLVEQLSSAVAILVFNYLFLQIAGNTGVAAYGVIANISLVVLSVFNGIAQGVQPLFSRSRASADALSERGLLRMAALCTVVFAMVAYILLFVFSLPVTQIFNKENSELLCEMAARGLKLYFLAAPFAGINILFCSYFAATETPLPAHILSLLRGFAVLIPAAFLLAALWGETGVWLAFPVTELLVCIAALAAYAILSRKRKTERFDG